MTQNESILAMLTTRWVSPMEALRECGCMRLAARIHDLRGAGFTIDERTARDLATGKSWSEYRLAPRWAQTEERNARDHAEPSPVAENANYALFEDRPLGAQEAGL